MNTKLFNVQNLLYLALILALLSSLGHVAFAFATTNGSNWPEAYLSAIAIDLGLLALAVGINKRKSEQRATWSLWLGVSLFSLISIYANWLAGIVHVQPLAVDVTGIAHWLVSLRPILLSGVLPILVIYLSEIVSGNYQLELSETAAALARTTRKAPKHPEQGVSDNYPIPAVVPVTDTLALARDAKKDIVDERRIRVLSLINNGKSQSQIASELDVSLATIKRDAAALNGKVKVTL